MLVVNYYVLDSLKRYVDDIVYLVKALFACGLALSLFQVEFKVGYRPLSTMLVVIVCGLFRNSDVSEMDKHIVSLILVVGVLFHAESGEPQVIQVNLEWAVARNQYVDSQVKLLPAD